MRLQPDDRQKAKNMDILNKDNIYVGSGKTQRLLTSAADKSFPIGGRAGPIVMGFTFVCNLIVLVAIILAISRREYNGLLWLVFYMFAWHGLITGLKSLAGWFKRRSDELRKRNESRVAIRDWLRVNTDSSQLMLLKAESAPNDVVWLTDDGLYWWDYKLDTWSEFDRFSVDATQSEPFVATLHMRRAPIMLVSWQDCPFLIIFLALMSVWCFQIYAVAHLLIEFGPRYDLIALAGGVFWTSAAQALVYCIAIRELITKPAIKLSFLTRLDGSAAEEEDIEGFLETRLRPVNVTPS
jgi:hypothetical protein